MDVETDFKPVIVEMLCVYELLVRMDLIEAEFFGMLQKDNRAGLGIKQGTRMRKIAIGPYEGDQDEFSSEWTSATHWWKGSTDALKKKNIWDRFKMDSDIPAFVRRIQAEGLLPEV